MGAFFVERIDNEMADNRHEKWELQQMQSLPLEVKIAKTKMRIQEWYEHFNGDVYVSFSGGKDSTVLLDICRQMYPGIKAMYLDTWMEYPEIRQFVKQFKNIDIIKPEMSMKEIVEQYGWNYPSKDVAEYVWYAKQGKEWAIQRLNGLNKDGTESQFRKRYKKFAHLIDAPFVISPMCCEIMKERPARKYETRTKSKPIMAVMACESQRRTTAWLRSGCNSFDGNKQLSKPMSFWTEQDVLQYIVENNLAIADVYGKIKQDAKGKYYTTGEQRTGCMFCPVGCHLDKENKFMRLKEQYPKIYEHFMKSTGQGGLGLGAFLDYINVEH